MSLRKTILKIYGWIFPLGFAYLLWIHITGLEIPCLLYNMTGVLCPGCGTTRMLRALAAFQIRQAFFYNPVVFILFSLWFLISVLCLFPKTARFAEKRFWYAALSVSVFSLAIFGIIRNFS